MRLLNYIPSNYRLIKFKLKNICLKTLQERFELNFYLENEANISIYAEKLLMAF